MRRRSPPAGLDRIVAGAAASVRRALPARRAAEPAISARSAEPATLQALRYGLRRDGFVPPLVAECLALFAGLIEEPLRPGVAAALRSLLGGAVMELADATARRQALAAAAAAHALRGDPVHVLAATEAAARDLAAFLEPRLARLGLRVSCISRELGMAARREAYAAAVVCAAQREVGLDYLRERQQRPQAPGELRARVQRLADPSARAVLPPLGCALVDDADLLLIDDAHAPLTLAAPVEAPAERLLYEQALELARALAPGKDYSIDDAGVHLAAPAVQLLERLVSPLGGAWSSAERRELLITLALQALHGLERDADYRVEGGRVLWPQSEGQADAPSGEELDLRSLVEVKEGCRLGGKVETLARLSVPRFYGRYAGIAGVCADARGIEADLWTLYSLATVRSGAAQALPVVHARVFSDAAGKRAALLERARQGSCVLGVRLRAELDALNALGAAAGVAIDAVVLPMLEPREPKPVAELAAAELPASRRHLAHACRLLGAARCALYLSLEDPGVVASLGPLLAWRARRAVRSDGELEKRWAARVASRALKGAEAAQRLARLDLGANDKMVEDLLAVSGRTE